MRFVEELYAQKKAKLSANERDGEEAKQEKRKKI